mgnify:CR=1 FL=1
MINKKSSNVARLRRHARVRAKVSGTSTCPRLNVFRSNKQIYAQIIDDVNGVTLCSASSCDEGLNITNGGNVAAAALVGKAVAEKALALNIKNVVFDRGGYLYHGRVKALADAAREAGLEF